MSTTSNDETPLAAVFVDVENMTMDRQPGRPEFHIGQVMDRVNGMMRPIVRKAYADWFRLRGLRDPFLRHGFDQVQTTYINRSKNTLDMQMCVDAMETVLLDPAIKAVVLVTADSDFSPLARSIRRHGRRVVAIGWLDKTNAVFRGHCDEFIPYESLAGVPAEAQAVPAVAAAGVQPARPIAGPGLPDGAEAPEATRPLTALNGTIARLIAQNGAGAGIPARFLAAALRREDGGVETTAFGFRTLSGLVNAHPLLRRGPGAGPGFTVYLPGAMRIGDVEDGLAPVAPEEAARRIAEEPVGFLGRDEQYDVLDALHQAFEKESDTFERGRIVDLAEQALDGVGRAEIERVERLLWEAKAYIVEERNSPDPMTWLVRLGTHVRDFDDLVFEHDKQLIARAIAAGIVLDARGWSRLLDEDDTDAEIFADMLADLGFSDPDFPVEPTRVADQEAAPGRQPPGRAGTRPAWRPAPARPRPVERGNGPGTADALGLDPRDLDDDWLGSSANERQDVELDFTPRLPEVRRPRPPRPARPAEPEAPPAEEASSSGEAPAEESGHRPARPDHVLMSPRVRRPYEDRQD